MSGRSITINTIAECIRYGHRITAYCLNFECGNSQELDLHALAERLGPDHSTLHKHLAPRLRCKVCNGKRIKLTVHPDARPAWKIAEGGEAG